MKKLLSLSFSILVSFSVWAQAQVGGTESPIYFKDGKTGIGTATPTYGKLEIAGDGLDDGLTIYNGSGATYRMYRIGNIAYLTRGGSNDKGFSFTSTGYVGLGYVNNTTFQLAVANGLYLGGGTNTRAGTLQINGTGADNGLTLWTANGDMTARLWIDASKDLMYLTKGSGSTNGLCIARNGSIGIGTEVTGTHKLAVEGTIGAREIKVETNGWADFVFKNDYQLRSLSDLESFIQTNNHLPDIPSEQEVKKNGISIGEMNVKLLQKIEELTLYVIDQQKQIGELQRKINKIENSKE